MTTDIELTPTERGVLFALMATGTPLREAADLRQRYRLGMTAIHRRRLNQFGLIKTQKSPFTHSLSELGWRWVEAEMRRPDVPKGQTGQGALQAVIGGLERILSDQGTNPRAFFAGTTPAVPQPEISETAARISASEREQQHLENAAWNDSEEALAFA
ncbi:MAG: hypothetical protein AAFO68_01565, partial [Pseudomonadota bacterium]